MRTQIGSKEEIEKRLDCIMGVLVRTVELKAQKRKRSPFTKRWWNKELSGLGARARQLGRVS